MRSSYDALHRAHDLLTLVVTRSTCSGQLSSVQFMRTNPQQFEVMEFGPVQAGLAKWYLPSQRVFTS